MELAGAVLGGKYEFVLTTHVDKDHLHNHLIFNSVSFVDYKKYHSNKQSYYHIRRTSDRICKEHGLSVVVPGQDRGKSYAEYTAEKQGTSYKAKLKTAIDNLIPRVKDFDELLRRLQEMGYEIKQGKYISFRAAGQERFTRTKTLGAAYTEEAIKERIKGVYVAKTKTLREDKKIRLVVDLENSIKAQQSAGYERWAKIHNLKQAAKSMNFLTENKIEYYSELESKIADIMTAHDAAAKAVKEVEQRILFLKSSLFAWRLIRESCTLIEASNELYISQRASKMAVLSSISLSILWFWVGLSVKFTLIALLMDLRLLTTLLYKLEFQTGTPPFWLRRSSV